MEPNSSLMNLLLTLQARKTNFDTLFVACQTPWLEPTTKDGPYLVVLALAPSEIQPETRIGIPIASAASVGFNLFNECVRRLHYLVGIEGRK